jgi:hypothetical protein
LPTGIIPTLSYEGPDAVLSSCSAPHERPSGHGPSARLPYPGKGAWAALLADGAARARIAPARRRCGACARGRDFESGENPLRRADSCLVAIPRLLEK